MKKGIYIVFNDFNESFPGVAEKIRSQINVFNTHELKTTVYIVKLKNGIQAKVGLRFPFINPYSNIINILEIINDIDFVYIRKPYINSKIYKLIKSIKRMKPSIIILVEFPSLPYGKEIKKGIKNINIIISDIIYRSKLHKYVDSAVGFSVKGNPFNLNFLNISNGINIRNIPICTRERNNTDINLVAAANFAKWHGYDRIIEGLHKYYSQMNVKRKVYFNLIGFGGECKFYETLVKKYNLEDKVIFYGYRKKEEIHSIYMKCDVAVEVLGMHRKNASISSSLKSREYLASGLPIVTSSKIDIITAEIDFVQQFEANENEIDIAKIIEFYDGLVLKYKNIENLSFTIRKFAEKKCDINSTFYPVIKYIKRRA